MSTIANQATKLAEEHKALQGKLNARHEAGLLAFKALCGPEIPVPQDMAEASALAGQWKRQRDNADRAYKDANEKLEKAAYEKGLLEGQHSKDFAELVAGTAEAELKAGGKERVAALIARLKEEKRIAEQAHTIAADAMTHAFMEMGLTQYPGAALAYAGKTPLVKALEAAAVYLYGNDRIQQAYLRRREWVFVGNGAWRGPTGVSPFNTAVEVQVAADVKPYKGLADALLNDSE